MSTRNANSQNQIGTIDWELIAQRILKLAEISVLEHLDGMARSQAVGLSEMRHRLDQEEFISGPGR